MSFPPLPPPDGNFSFSQTAAANSYPRRPQVWVPPVIIFGAFAAGYAIPWDLGQEPGRVFTQMILPLLISAFLCGVAGFYSYRTVPGWRNWTWVALGAMTLNGIQFLAIPAMQMPVAVSVLIWTSSLGLLICGALGQEKNSALYQQPKSPSPGIPS